MKSYRNYFSFLLVVHFLSAIDDGSDILLWSLKSLSPCIREGGETCSTNFSFTIHQTAKNVNDFDLLQPLKRVLSEWLGKEGVSSLWREEKENKRQKERKRERERKNITNNDSCPRRFTLDENRQGFLLYPLRSRDIPYEHSSLEGLQASSTGKSCGSLDGSWCLDFQAQIFCDGLHNPEDEGSRFFLNVGNTLPADTPLNPRRLVCPASQF